MILFVVATFNCYYFIIIYYHNDHLLFTACFYHFFVCHFLDFAKLAAAEESSDVDASGMTVVGTTKQCR